MMGLFNFGLSTKHIQYVSKAFKIKCHELHSMLCCKNLNTLVIGKWIKNFPLFYMLGNFMHGVRLFSNLTTLVKEEICYSIISAFGTSFYIFLHLQIRHGFPFQSLSPLGCSITIPHCHKAHLDRLCQYAVAHLTLRQTDSSCPEPLQAHQTVQKPVQSQ